MKRLKIFVIVPNGAVRFRRDSKPGIYIEDSLLWKYYRCVRNAICMLFFNWNSYIPVLRTEIVGQENYPPPPWSVIWNWDGFIKLLIVDSGQIDVDHLNPLPLDQQNMDLRWIDKIVDWQSRADLCWLPFPNPQINKIQIWAGWTILLIVDLGWIHVGCFPPPPHHTQSTQKLLSWQNDHAFWHCAQLYIL